MELGVARKAWLDKQERWDNHIENHPESWTGPQIEWCEYLYALPEKDFVKVPKGDMISDSLVPKHEKLAIWRAVCKERIKTQSARDELLRPV